MSIRRGLLVLDMSYTLQMIRERQLEQALHARDVGGFFSHVVSVHPLAGLFETSADRFGAPKVTRIADRHLFVEGRLGASRWLAALPPLNFIVAQIRLFRTLVRLARENRVAAVRVGDPYYLGLFGWALARRLHVPLAIRVPSRYDEIRRITGRATMPRLFRYPWVEKWIERFVFPRCDLIAGANEDNMRYAIENGGRPAVATVFRYGNLIHPSHWVVPDRRQAADADLAELGVQGVPVVATIARLEPMKRVEDFINAVAELAGRGVTVRGLIIGDGSARARLEAYAREMSVGDAIVFAGNRTQEWIARVLPHADVILSPHMGRGLVEAALSGAPIVAFDYDWQGEIISDGETGYLVPNGDCVAMADRAARLLGDRELRQQLGRHGRARVAALMDPDTLMRHEQTTYAALLERWPRRSWRLSDPSTAAHSGRVE